MSMLEVGTDFATMSIDAVEQAGGFQKKNAQFSALVVRVVLAQQ